LPGRGEGMSAIETVREDIRRPWDGLPGGKTYGVVYHMRHKRGFGFLFERMSLIQLFFHAAATEEFHDLKRGDLVSFEVVEDDMAGGMKAINVKKVGDGDAKKASAAM